MDTAPSGPGKQVPRTTRMRLRDERGAIVKLAPWALVVALVVGSGFGGYYMTQKQRLLAEELTAARTDVVAARQRAAVANRQIMNLEADLLSVRGEFEGIEVPEAPARRGVAADLDGQLADIARRGRGKVERADERRTLALSDKVLFDGDGAELTERGRRVLDEVATVLDRFPGQRASVEGHSPRPADGVNSWELSAARAVAIVRYLHERAGVDPARLVAVALGEHHLPQRRSRPGSRRVEITLAPAVAVAN